MADRLRLYIVCPGCNGTGVVSWGDAPDHPGERPCPTCCDGDVIPSKVFDGLYHVYYGRFEEVVEEEA